MYLRDRLCLKKILFACCLPLAALFCLFYSSSALAADNRQIQYWTSSGESWAAFDEGLYGIDFSFNSDSHSQYPDSYASFQVTPAQQAQGFQIKLKNLRVWFYLPDLTGKQAASGTFHLVLYPNSNDQNWYCYQLGHISASLRSVNDVASVQTSSPSCQVYYENSSVAIRLTTKFVISPTLGGAFASNPYLYVTFNNDVSNTPVIQNNSNYNPPYTGTYLVLYDNVILDDINYSSDPNTGILNDISNKLDDLDSGEQRRWEQDHEDEAAKEQELEEQADDLSLSTPVSGNPFTSWFFNSPFNLSSNPCVNLPNLSALFGRANDVIQVCSPYPPTARNIMTIVTNMLLTAFVIRLYYKKLKGGVDG